MKPTFREKEYKYWNEWLPEDLGLKLDEIKRKANDQFIACEREPHLKYFTPHGKNHCQAVEDNIHRLIPNELHKSLSQSEKFFLLGSAWLHDIGMFRGVLHSDKDAIESDEKIRDIHHLRSEKFIAERYSEIGVDETEAAAFGLLARFHRRRCDINECPNIVSLPFHGVIRTRLLAAYLRLADALHIDATRAPSNQYAISLTYNIPYRVKLHWLRSIFVIGTHIDIKKKEIVVHLKSPDNDIKIEDRKRLERSLKYIHELIIQDLNGEIDSVKNVLIQANITRFLSANPVIHHIKFDPAQLRELTPVLNYYHLLDNPSSSGLPKLVLESLEGILEAHAKNDKDVIIDGCIKDCLTMFLDEVEENILVPRKCHFGLESIITDINIQIEKKPTIRQFIEYLESKNNELMAMRIHLRSSAHRYFMNYLANENSNINYDYVASSYDLEEPDRKINILLYGYSELVMKTLCGFKDSIITELLKIFIKDLDKDIKSRGNDQKQLLFHKERLEKKASKYFRIFCCEGQPKNHTTWGGRLLHHDGTRYALSLIERGFKEIHVIPDAVASTLIGSSVADPCFPLIDFVIVGANGFDDKFFRHSAGHLMVVASSFFAKNPLQSMSKKAPCVILSITSDKYRAEFIDNTDPSQPTDTVVERDGWLFQMPFGQEKVRDHSFISQDKNLQKALKQNDSRVVFYNPREDRVPINHVDVVITEKAFLVKDLLPEEKWNGYFFAEETCDSSLPLSK